MPSSEPQIVLQSVETLEKTTFSGRTFTRKQLAQIQETVHLFRNLSRHELAQTLCEHLSWVTPNKRNKVESSLTLLEELEKHGVIALPQTQQRKKAVAVPSCVKDAAMEAEIATTLDAVGLVELQEVHTKDDRASFKDYLRKYHYLGYRQCFGQQVGYFLVSKTLNRRLGCLLFSASAAQSLSPRDQWIGWDDKHRKKLRHLVVSNNRFLIFPWVNVPNLATKALSLCTQRIAEDWVRRYHYRPVLLETFVDTTKYSGTCYHAANWQNVGQTQGRGRNDTHGEAKETIKDIYMLPLIADFRHHLTGDVRASTLKKKYRNDVRLSHTRSVDDAFVSVWQNVIHIVSEVASEYDEAWQLRKRLLNTLLLMLFVFRLVCSKNTQSYGATIDELWDSCKALNLPLPQKGAPAPSSFCSARKKLDEAAFQTVHQRILEAYKPEIDARYQWLGHRLFAVDGSKVHLPHSFVRLGYPLPSESTHYPQGLLSCLYQLKSQIPFDFGLFQHANERTAARGHLTCLQKNDVVVYDRGYFSYFLLHRHHDSGIHAVFRLPDNSFKVIQDFFGSDQTDVIVTIDPSGSTRKDMQKEHPDLEIVPIAIRLLKYRVGTSTFVLGTTLLESRYALEDFKNVYHERWGIEELYKVSKRVFNVEDFHAKTERGVKQELFAHFVLITMNRIFANHADDSLNRSQQTSATSQPLKTNFKSCVRVFTRHIEALLLLHQNVKTVVQEAFRHIVGRYQKFRPRRSFPRVSFKPASKWRPSKNNAKPKSQPMLLPASVPAEIPCFP